MQNYILNQGDKLLVAHRRLFEGDESRYFVGEIEASNDVVVQVTGYTLVKEQYIHSSKKRDLRTKIFSLSSGTFIVYLLKPTVDVETIEIKLDNENSTTLVDKNGFIMDLTERHHIHPQA